LNGSIVDAVLQVHRSGSIYPTALKTYLGHRAPAQIFALGDLDILQTKPLALFCSRKCPGNLILQTYDLAQHWRDQGVTVIGGFHSPMERECLNILLRSPHPVIICPARGLPRRIEPEFKRPLAEDRLLLLSAFPDSIKRATEETAHQRNRVVAALADKIFIAYAEPNSKTELFCREIVAWDRPLFTLASDANQNLIALGAKPFTADAVAQ
jgi:predicted Rossmann fold nucleotide-binding protein DprA/Smf involved in DNA uptake